MHNQLSEQIANTVYESYESIKPISKPCIRTNGQKEWTVLASMVAIDEVKNDIKVVSLGTGVKVTPNDDLGRSCGRILHDCHAEIIALRAFNSVLMKEAITVRNGLKSYLVEKSSNGYVVKKKWKFGLYVSRLPCGDASMDFLESDDRSNDGSNLEAWSTERRLLNPGVQTILRGRDHYTVKSVVRTKPGRADSDLTLSKSCSDKLTLKQIYGLFSAHNWFLFDDLVFLDYLIIPKQFQQYTYSLQRCFHERLSMTNSTMLKFIFCERTFIHDKSERNQVPGLISACMLNCTENKIEEAILNGVKNGFYVKGNKPLRKNCHSVISRFGQWVDFKTLCDQEFEDYLTFKSSLIDRKNCVNYSKKLLSSDGWICTLSDNCS